MNPASSASTAPPRSRFRVVHWVLIILAAFMIVVVVQAAGALMLAREARDLRSALHVAAGRPLDREIEFSVGPVLLGLGRTLVSFVDDVPPEARLALSAVRHASVGIYKFKHRPDAAQRLAMLEAAAAEMADHNWQRVVTVSDGNDLVMIYVPAELVAGGEIDLCLAVCDGEEMVIVSARIDPEPIQRLVDLQHDEIMRVVRR